jgi:hypothetical protein
MPSISAVHDPDVTAAFPRRPRPGILMGLRLGQVALLAGAVFVGVLALFTSVFPGPTRGVALGVVAAFVLLAITQVDGRPAYTWLAVRSRHALRGVRGDTAIHRPVLHGRGRKLRLAAGMSSTAGLLPGRAAAITVREIGGVAYLHHPHDGTVTAVVEVTSPEFLLRDPIDRNARVAGWGRVLAAATRTGAIRQVHLLERSIPDDGSALTDYTREHLTTDPQQLTLADAYTDLVWELRGGADRHESYLAITVDVNAARSSKDRKDPDALARTWQQEFGVLRRLLPTAGLDVVRELDTRGIARLVRTGYDPSAVLRLPRDVDLDIADAGPVGGRDAWDHVQADGAFHAVLWVAEWPRAHVAADVLWPIVFPSGVQRTLSLFYRPFTRVQSEAAIRAKHSEIIQSSWLKHKLGRVETLADSKELDDVLARESELLAGHGEVGLVGMITVTAASLADLDDAVSTVHAAATQASMDVRRLYGQQLQAFTAAALPLGTQVVT